MTEPVTRATSPRRTVRVATALVTGQALLCAVIGWVTFGPSEQPPRASAPVGSLAGPQPSLELPGLPPAALPAPTVKSPVPSRSARRTEPPSTLSGTRPSPSRKPSTPARPARTSDQPLLDPAPGDSPVLTVPAPNPMLTPAPTESPVVVEGACEPEGARGETAAGVELSCARRQDGSLVWLIN